MQAGGIDLLGGALKAWRKEDKDLLFVGAGDLVGASPALSSMWADEPSIDRDEPAGPARVSSVGNHEFDQGRKPNCCASRTAAAIRRADKACQIDGPPSSGAGFTYLAANVVDQQTGKPCCRPTASIDVKGVKVG
jgi:5'-nucleotidase